MQKLILVGRATKDAEVLTSKDGDKKYAAFSIAVNHKSGDDWLPTYYECLYFGNTEKLIERVKKGSTINIIGRPTPNAYINKNEEAVGGIKVFVDDYEALR